MTTIYCEIRWTATFWQVLKVLFTTRLLLFVLSYFQTVFNFNIVFNVIGYRIFIHRVMWNVFCWQTCRYDVGASGPMKATCSSCCLLETTILPNTFSYVVTYRLTCWLTFPHCFIISYWNNSANHSMRRMYGPELTRCFKVTLMGYIVWEYCSGKHWDNLPLCLHSGIDDDVAKWVGWLSSYCCQ